MKPILFLMLLFGAVACRTTSKPGLFSKKTPHELYIKKINDAGLASTVLGRTWLEAATSALSTPVTVNKPYKETGFFSAGQPAATGLRFQAIQGEKLQITINRKPASGFNLYLDLWQQDTINPSNSKLLASSDTTGLAIQYDIDKSGYYVIRLQPELLQDCEYTLAIEAAASLAYPVKATGKNQIQSFWGAARDAGARKHEGVDIFAPRKTPVIAAADGLVSRVNENNLGGKVVWLRPRGKDYTLYYAHLDSQLVRDGQQVRTGDTLGLMGNTGNARSTPPHLHFGIYAFGGAIDPLPFINPDYPPAANVRAELGVLGDTLKTSSNIVAIHSQPDRKSLSAATLPKNSVVTIEAAVADWYRVRTPGGITGYLPSSAAISLAPIRTTSLRNDTPLLSKPDRLAAAKAVLPSSTRIIELAVFGSFNLVRTDTGITGWVIAR